MAKTEAFCTQCGSLINIDDSKDKSKCLFCGTEIDTAKALNLKGDSESRLAIQKEAEKKAVEEAKIKKDAAKLNKGTKSDSTPQPPAVKEEVVIRPLPLKTKLILFGAFLGIVAILCGIFIPTILTRNEKRELFSPKLQQIQFPLQSYAFKYNDNRELIVATGSEIREEDARAAYETYSVMYKNAYDISSEKTMSKLVVKVYAKNGLFICKGVGGVLATTFTTSTPTPTTAPTTAIVSK